MSNTEEYNGWTNRETWACHLHLSNDQGMYESCREATRESLEEYVCELLDPAYWRDSFGESMPREIELMKDDIGSLWRVNWDEIVEALEEE